MTNPYIYLLYIHCAGIIIIMMICDELMFLIHTVLSTGTHSPSMRSNMHGPYWWPACMEWCGGWKLVDGSGTQSILCIVHVHDVVTDWSYALVWFLFPRFFVVPLANPSNFSHCKCFSNRIPFFFQYRSINLRIMTCISGTSRGSTEVQEEKTGLIRYLLEYLWTNNYSNE